MRRFRRLALVVGASAAAVALMRHAWGTGIGRRVRGGVVIGDTGAYDAVSRLFLGSFFDGVAANVASAAPDGARVLEVGCGPGRLSIRLAAAKRLEVTGLDLDPAMVERARANAERAATGHARPPSFVVGDVASLAFADATFDLVVSTLSMHHWANPAAGLTEIGRVVRPGGRALIWDLQPGIVPFHTDVPDLTAIAHGSSLALVSADRWRWPWRLSLIHRLDLARDGGEPRAG